MAIPITGMFEPSGGAGAFNLYDPQDIAAGNINVALQLISGGQVLAGSHASAPVGELVIQRKTTTGAPTHTATEGTLCWNTVDNTLYCNSDGATAWVFIGVTNGNSHDHAGGDGAQVDHGGLAGLGDDDHTQYAQIAAGETITGVWQLSTGGAVKGGSHATAPVGEIVAQVKTTTGAPSHSASEGTMCWNSVDNKFYVNADGATAWQEIGAGGGVSYGTNTELANVTKAAEDAGVSSLVSRADHKHDIDAAAAGASAFGDSAAEGTATSLARSDHRHSREANPVTAHEAAGDPHTGYRLESADHSHQSTGAQAGQLDHGLALTGLADDDHSAYLLASDATNRATFAANWLDLTDGGASTLHSHAGGGGAHSLLDGSTHTDTLADTVTDGDVIIGNATPKWSSLAISVPGANVRNVLGVDNGELRPSWKAILDGTNPAAVAASAAPGTSLVAAHRDHVHGFAGFVWMPIAEWFIGGPMRADASNHLGKVVKLPDYATACAALTLSCNLVTAPTGSAANFDIKYSTTFGGALTSLFSTTPTISASANEDSAAVFNPTTIDGVKYLRLYCTQKGSTEPGRDLTVQVWAKVHVEF